MPALSLYCSGAGINGVLATTHIASAFREAHPFRPFWTFAYNPGFFQMQDWAKRNTAQDSVFLVLVNPRDNNDMQLTFSSSEEWRGNAERDSYIHGLMFIYNEGPAAYIELKRRKDVAQQTITSLRKGDYAGALSVLKTERIDYVIVPLNYDWPETTTVYSNAKYRVIALQK